MKVESGEWKVESGEFELVIHAFSPVCRQAGTHAFLHCLSLTEVRSVITIVKVKVEVSVKVTVNGLC